MARRYLRNRSIKPGELGYGFLFFPGKDEAQTAARLRLAVEIGGRQHIVQIPTVPAGAGNK